MEYNHNHPFVKALGFINAFSDIVREEKMSSLSIRPTSELVRNIAKSYIMSVSKNMFVQNYKEDNSYMIIVEKNDASKSINLSDLHFGSKDSYIIFIPNSETLDNIETKELITILDTFIYSILNEAYFDPEDSKRQIDYIVTVLFRHYSVYTFFKQSFTLSDETKKLLNHYLDKIFDIISEKELYEILDEDDPTAILIKMFINYGILEHCKESFMENIN